jgi:hypothetical protein
VISAGGFDLATVSRLERFYVCQVFQNRGLVALLLIGLVPLVVVVEDEGDDIGAAARTGRSRIALFPDDFTHRLSVSCAKIVGVRLALRGHTMNGARRANLRIPHHFTDEK